MVKFVMQFQCFSIHMRFQRFHTVRQRPQRKVAIFIDNPIEWALNEALGKHRIRREKCGRTYYGRTLEKLCP